MSNKLVYTVSFSHAAKPVEGVRSNVKAAYALASLMGGTPRTTKGYNELKSELRKNNFALLSLADKRVATIEALELSAA